MENRRPFLVLRLNLLGKPLFIVLNDLAGPLHNQTGATVIRIQQYPFCCRIILLEMQHNFRLRAPEPIDGLVVVAHDEQIILRRGQHPHDIVLELVDILKLIHQNIPELPLPGPENILPLLQKLVAVDQHIVKIDFIAAPQPVVILIENGKKALRITGSSLIFLQVHPVIFHLADLRGDAANQLRLVVGLQLLLIDGLPQKLIFLILPENIVGPIAVGQLQDLEKDRVEGTKRNRRIRAVRQSQIPLLHFPCRRFCKGDHQNLSGWNVTDFRQILNPSRKHHRLTGTGSRQNQHGAVTMSDGLLLYFR